jgi:hypothetical protein
MRQIIYEHMLRTPEFFTEGKSGNVQYIEEWRHFCLQDALSHV